MKKINLVHPYIMVEEIDNENTEGGLVLATSNEEVDVFVGTVVNVFENCSDLSVGDNILFLKERSYKYIDGARKYYIISITEDFLAKVDSKTISS